MEKVTKIFMYLGLISVFMVISDSAPHAFLDTGNITSMQIPWHVLDEGGEMWLSSADFKLSSSLGQSAIGVQHSAYFILFTGFWNPWVVQMSTGPIPLCGDANGDGVVDGADIIYLLNFLFRNGLPPDPWHVGDVNLDGVVGPGDIVYLINYLYRGGPPPCEPLMANLKPVVHK